VSRSATRLRPFHDIGNLARRQEMSGSTALAVVAAAVAAFVLSSVWYTVLGQRLARWSPAYADSARPTGAVVALELLRSLVVAAIVGALG